MTMVFERHGLHIDGLVFLSPREAAAFLAQDAVLVDLRDGLERNGREFDVGNVVLMTAAELAEGFASLPRDRPIILADCVGLGSKKAQRFLLEQGYTDVASLNGGMVDWERDGLPTRIDRNEELSGGCACRLRPGGMTRSRSGC